MRRALFIVFEGIDGSGTTTQCELLAARFEAVGKVVVRTREPGGTPLAEKIRKLVLDPSEEIHDTTEMYLYAASRADHVEAVIAPALEKGKIVVCDRFVASSLAYQGYGRNLGFEKVWEVNRHAVGECLPDLTIYLDLPIQEARDRRLRRGEKPDRLEQAGDRLQERVAEAYRELARLEPNRSLMLDATSKKEQLAEEVWREVEARWRILEKSESGD